MSQDAEQLDDDGLRLLPLGGLQRSHSTEQIVTIGRSAFSLPDRGLSQQAIDLLIAEDTP
jgi:hypothetical protein